MSVSTKHTVQAFRSNFELVCIFSLIIIAADFTWLLHDVIKNGLSVVYGLIGTGMIVGFVGTTWVLYRHNSKLVRGLNKELLKTKLFIMHSKTHHNGETLRRKVK